MTFEEMQKDYDVGLAFGNWKSIKEAKQSGELPEIMWDDVPDTCECGSEFIYSPEFKAVMCCSPKCYVKKGMMLSELITRYGIPEFGAKTGVSIYNMFMDNNEKKKASLLKNIESDYAALQAVKEQLDKEYVAIQPIIADSEEATQYVELLSFKHDVVKRKIDEQYHKKDTTDTDAILDQLMDIILDFQEQHVELMPKLKDVEDYYSTLIDYTIALLQVDKKKEDLPGIYKTDSIMEILLTPPEDYPLQFRGTAKSIQLQNAILKMLSEPITYSTMIQRLGITSIDTKAKALFKGISSYTQLCQEINRAGGLINFCAYRGVYDSMVLFWFYNSAMDIYLASKFFKRVIRMEGVVRWSVSMTGRIKLRGSSISKEKFIQECNNLMRTEDGIQLLEVTKTDGFKTNPYIIYSAVSNNRHYRIGLDRGVEYDGDTPRRVLITADDFYSMLERKKEEWIEIIRQEQENQKQKLEEVQQDQQDSSMTTTTTTKSSQMNLF